MKFLAITLAIIATARAANINNPVSRHRQTNDEAFQVGKSNSDALVANPGINKHLETKAVEKNKVLNTFVMAEAKNLNISGIVKEISGLNDSVDVAVQGSKIAECIYEGVKSFVLCMLNQAEDFEDLIQIFPFIKCASTAVIDATTCFFNKSAELQSLSDAIVTNNNTSEIYKTIHNTVMNMLKYNDDFNVNKLAGTTYELD